MKPVPPVTKTFTAQAYPARPCLHSDRSAAVQKRRAAADPLRRGAPASRTRAPASARWRSPSPRAASDDDPLAELKELLRTAGVATAGELIQHRAAPDPDRYLGRGKLAELKAEIAAATPTWSPATTSWRRARSATWRRRSGVPVIDRTAVILDIFADHAHSAEGKLQVELAQLEYNLARMRGLWTHLERLGGGIGTRGPGETPDRDRPPPGPRPDRRAAPPPRAARAQPRGDAGPARALRAADGRARRLHQRGQVDAAERADRRRGRRGRPALPHARPDHAQPTSSPAATTC